MYSMASESTDAVSVFPKGETNCWSAVILSPIFSFLTLKAGIGEGLVSFRVLFDVCCSAEPFFVEDVSRDWGTFFGFSSKFWVGNWWGMKVGRGSLMEVAEGFQNGALLENWSWLWGDCLGGEFLRNWGALDHEFAGGRNSLVLFMGNDPIP